MLFLLLRLLPAAIPVFFFATVKTLFLYGDKWPWFLGAVLVPPLLYFALLKHKNRDKPVLLLAAYALIFAVTGFAYALILENSSVITAYLLGWSLVYWLYLEAVFHDFYETAKAYVFNLLNITLYGNILIIFFLTAALASFNIFLSLPWPGLLLISAAVNFSVIHLAFQRFGLPRPRARLYAGASALILTEILGGLLFLPTSFYLIALIAALCYYLLMQILLPNAYKTLSRRRLFELLSFVGAILLLAALTAAWL